MREFANIEEVIRSHIHFRHGIAAEGWNSVYCEVCGDGSRTKGPRGGWLFSDGGSTAAYHCFNCGEKCTISTERQFPLSKTAPKVLTAFGIDRSSYAMLLLKNRKTGGDTQVRVSKAFVHNEIPIPDYFYALSQAPASNPVAAAANEFLKSKYGLNKNDYSFYLSSGTSKSPEMTSVAKTMLNRVIVPYFKGSKMIYFQGRDITGKSKMKYAAPDVSRSNILFGMDTIFVQSNDPIYVVESAFDAIHLGGVSTMQNALTNEQIEILEKTPRRKIVVPDFNGDSFKLAETAIKLGWDISVPNYNNSCNDVSDAVLNYGKLYTFYDIHNNVKSGLQAEIALNLIKHKNLQRKHK